MTDAERAEVAMREFLGVVPPWDRPWKRRAFELVLLKMPTIRAYQELGLTLVKDPRRHKLISQYTGEQNGHEHEEYGFNVWLLDECIGDRIMSSDHIFMRCLGCSKIRTSKGMANGLCKCGSNRLSSAAGVMDTRKAMGYLASGY